jgi:UDP-GlcNAc:undecaprenyl-phosphate GlcNAc-1-phosphate transferase
MRTIFAVLITSLCLAIVLTPLAALIGRHYGMVDAPSGRKVHTKPIPRIGGVAIYLAFFGPFLGALFCSNGLIVQILSEPAVLWVSCGATLVFLVGFADDIFPLHPLVKFGVQAAAACLAYHGGACISLLQFPGVAFLGLGWFSLPVTIFWFLLITNAFNLIDGLDGLAAGVCLFASLILLILSVMAGRYLVATGLAALVGACLGFLRYNFNPASIFMGDGGSYFLGFMLASLSILGSIKSQATVAILIPIIALGLPLVDTIIAPVRRFVMGRQLFQADKSHIHHKLLRLGFSQRGAVLLLYGANIVLGLFAVLLVNAQDRNAALILLVLAVCVIAGIRKLGYLEGLAVDKMVGYVQDVTDVVGLSKDRRTFLDRQMAIGAAADIEQLWDRIVDALELLKIDRAEIRFDGVCCAAGENNSYCWHGGATADVLGPCQDSRFLSINLPLADDQKCFGALYLAKDVISDPISHYTLRRVEHLRRSIVRKLVCFNGRGKVGDPAPERSPGPEAAKELTVQKTLA